MYALGGGVLEISKCTHWAGGFWKLQNVRIVREGVLETSTCTHWAKGVYEISI